MDIGQGVLIFSQLILGALASFFAIMLWSKTRDTAWMLIVIGTIAAYIEIIYTILKLFGFINTGLLIGSVPLMAIILPSLRMIFFIAAFYVMVVKRYRR